MISATLQTENLRQRLEKWLMHQGHHTSLKTRSLGLLLWTQPACRNGIRAKAPRAHGQSLTARQAKEWGKEYGEDYEKEEEVV